MQNIGQLLNPPGDVNIIVQAGLREAAAALHAPPGPLGVNVNPYTWLQSFYQYRGLREAFGHQVQVLFLLASIAAVLSFVTLVLQWRQRHEQPPTFWFVRKFRHDHSKWAYWVPHPTNIVLLGTLLTSILLITYLSFAYDAWQNDHQQRAIKIGSWFPAAWVTFFAVVWLSGFGSLYLTFLIPTRFTRRSTLTGIKRWLSPVVNNVLCFGVPCLVYVTLLPLQVRQSECMRVAMRSLSNLNATMDILAREWTPNGPVFTPVDQAVLFLQMAQTASADVQSWRNVWTAELAVWSLWTILAMAVAVPMILTLVLSTHRRIRRMAAINHDVFLPTLGKDTAPIVHSPLGTSPTASTVKFDTPRSFLHLSDRNITSSINLEAWARDPSSACPSGPASVAQTPNLRDFQSQPFFTFSSAITAEDSPTVHLPRVTSFSTLAPSAFEAERSLPASPRRSPHVRSMSLPALSIPTSAELSANPGLPSLPSTPATPGSHQSRFSSHNSTASLVPQNHRASLKSMRRMSSYAIFPSRVPDADGRRSSRSSSDSGELNKRYWFVAGQYITVFLIMAFLCGFAVFQAVTADSILTDCSKSNLATLVVAWLYCILVNLWLALNLVRLLKTARNARSNKTASQQGGARATDDQDVTRDRGEDIVGSNNRKGRGTSPRNISSSVVSAPSHWRRGSAHGSVGTGRSHYSGTTFVGGSGPFGGLQLSVDEEDEQDSTPTERPGDEWHHGSLRRRSSAWHTQSNNMDIMEALNLSTSLEARPREV